MFRKALALVAIGLVVSSDASAQQAAAQQTIVRKGAGLKMALLQPLDSRTAKEGDDVPLRLSRPLVVNGVTLLREGEILYGKVTRVKHAGPRCHNGEVKFKLNQVPFADGTTARSKVRFITPDPDTKVADQMDSTELGPAFWFFAAPFYLAIVVIASPVLLINALSPGTYNSCTIPGKEYQLPANATVAVVIMKDHHVSY
jgi:hypothetical protein